MSDIFYPSDGVAGGAGNVTNKTQRVTIATDDINIAAINANIDALANNNESFAGSQQTVTSGSYKTLVTVSTGTYDYLGAEIVSAAGSTAALSELIVQVKDHANGEWYSLIGNADWADTGIPILLFATSSPAPHEVDAGETAHFRIHINKAYSARIVAKTAANSALITCRGYAA